MIQIYTITTIALSILYVLPVLSQENDILLNDSGVSEGCQDTVCVSKCCPDGELISSINCTVPSNKNELWEPKFYDTSYKLSPIPPANVKFIYQFPACEMYLLQPHDNPDDAFYLLQDGLLDVPIYVDQYQSQSYCIDNMLVTEDKSEEVALLCFQTPKTEPSKVCTVAKEYVYPVLLIVSCIFLLVTLIVYICIPELRGKLHGRCLMSMVSSLLAAYILMTIVQLGSRGMSDNTCIFCAFLKQFTILASFFWLNVMCFDIWRSLSSMRPAAETSAKSRQRFLIYSLYAWGSPFVAAVVTIIIQTLDKSHTGLIRPDFLNAKEICWFDSWRAMWLYFYMFILILVVANTIFFCLVAILLFKSQNNQQLQRARSQNRDRMWLYGKLFVVMGITWIAEVISYQQGTCEAWIVTDVINALQGLAIFLVFVCKKSTRQMVGKKMSKMKSTISSSEKSKRSSTFFMSLSKSSSSQNTDSSVISNSVELQSLTGTTDNPRNPPGQMVVINEEVQETLSVPQEDGDEDCPSIPEDSERPEDIQSNDESPGELQVNTTDSQMSEPYLSADKDNNSKLLTSCSRFSPESEQDLTPLVSSELGLLFNGIHSNTVNEDQRQNGTGEGPITASSQLEES